MDTPDDILRTNVDALMRHHWGKTNQLRLAKLSGTGLATAQRLKSGDSSFRLETVAKLAAAFNLQAWQLLHPRLDLEGGVSSPAGLSSDALAIATRLDAITDPSAKRRALALAMQTIDLIDAHD
jgi:hypothetical protein